MVCNVQFWDMGMFVASEYIKSQKLCIFFSFHRNPAMHSVNIVGRFAIGAFGGFGGLKHRGYNDVSAFVYPADV